MRVVYFGMQGAFSVPPLRALLGAGVEVCAVVVPALLPGDEALAPLTPQPRAGDIALLHTLVEPNIVQLAWQHHLPAFAVRHLRAPATRAALAALRPHIGCVACFPQRLPAALLALPPHGLLNVHPSLLPHGRGPEPLFWTFRNGGAAGVTVHAMSAALDAGDIVAQAPVALPDGASGAEAERRCATVGGALLVAALQALERGTLARQPQQGGSYQPAPSAEDFMISTGWSAQRVFNFMRGTAEWGVPYRVAVGGVELRLRVALSYAQDGTLAAPYVAQAGVISLQCTPGIVRAALA